MLDVSRASTAATLNAPLSARASSHLPLPTTPRQLQIRQRLAHAVSALTARGSHRVISAYASRVAELLHLGVSPRGR